MAFYNRTYIAYVSIVAYESESSLPYSTIFPTQQYYYIIWVWLPNKSSPQHHHPLEIINIEACEIEVECSDPEYCGYFYSSMIP